MIVAPKHHLSLFVSTLCLILSSVFMTACGDEPANDAPTVIGRSTYALCSLRDGADSLSEVHFVIEDLQGSDTLLAPYVAYRNITIPVTESIIPAPTSEELSAANEAGTSLNACSVDSCQMQYSWTYNRNDEQSGLLRCDENSQIDVIIRDINNNEKEFKIFVMREE